MSQNYKRNYLLLILVTVIVLSLSGYFYITHEEEKTRRDKYADIALIAKMKADAISANIKHELENAEVISKDIFLVDRIEHYLAKTENNKINLRNYIQRIINEHGYEDIVILSNTGKIIFAIRKDINRKFNMHLAKCIKQAINEKKVTFTDLHWSLYKNIIRFDFVAPILDEKLNVIAAIILRKNPYKSIFPVIQKWSAISKSSENLVVRRDGDSILYLNELRHKKNTALKFKVPINNEKLPEVKAVLGFTGFVEGIDYRGVKVLSDIRPIPNTNWFMVSKIDLDEIFEELNYRTKLTVAIVLLLFLIAVIAVAVVHYYISMSHIKVLLAKQEEINIAYEEFKTTLYSIGDAVITTDTKAHVKQMNSVAEKLTGWKEYEAVGRPIQEVFKIINEKTRYTVDNPVEKVLREGIVVGLANHTLLVSKDGSEKPIADSGAPIKEKNGVVIGVVLVFRDQTEEYKIQQQIEENEKKFRLIFDTSPDAISISKLSTGELVELNEGFCNLSGYCYNEVIGKTSLELGLYSNPSDRELIINKIKNENKVDNLQVVFKRKNGSYLTCFMSVRILVRNSEKYLLSVNRDVTEMIKNAREIERYKNHLEVIVDERTQQLNEANRKLSEEIKKEKEVEAQLEANLTKEKELNQLKSRFISTTSHEFRTPLTTVLSSAELILRNIGKINDDKILAYVNRIKNSVAYLTKLMDDIITLNKADSGNLKNQPSKINLKELCEEALETAQMFSTNRHTADFLYLPTQEEYILDGKLMRFIISNLLVNAFKYSPNGGKVILEVNANENELVIKISDEGIGIPEEEKSHLFEPFYRSSNSVDIQGTGLGLSIVKKSVELQNGKISFESKIDIGTSFTITLPK